MLEVQFDSIEEALSMLLKRSVRWEVAFYSEGLAHIWLPWRWCTSSRNVQILLYCVRCWYCGPRTLGMESRYSTWWGINESEPSSPFARNWLWSQILISIMRSMTLHCRYFLLSPSNARFHYRVVWNCYPFQFLVWMYCQLHALLKFSLVIIMYARGRLVV
jgi:hypothetical protein